MLVTVTVKCFVLLMVSFTLKCSVLFMITVTLQCSIFLVVTVTVVFSVPYGHCHSAPYIRSAVVLNVPGPRTASRQNNAAASHSCHFNTVLYPKS